LSVQPAQTLAILPENVGDFITYSGAINELDVFGAKLSPYLVTPEKPIITAWTYLMSQRTGQPLLCCDSADLTIARTAGVTALAVDALAKPQSDTLCIIGSGPLALAHLSHVLALRSWASVRVYSPSLARDKAKQKAFKAICSSVLFSDDVEQAIQGAQVIMLCTSSGTPVLAKELVEPGVLVTSISTNAPNAHEISPAFLSDADVYCDYQETAPLGAGEMKIAIEQGTWSLQKIAGDLPQLMANTCELPSYNKPIYFRSIGLGLEDVAIAYGHCAM
jgi:L-arginine dehydrogenase